MRKFSKFIFVLFVLGCGVEQSLRAQSFTVNDADPAIEVYMYGNASTGDPQIPIWGYFDPNSGVDTRMSQEIVGWNTAALIATNQTPTHYLIKRCRVTLTTDLDHTFFFDPTHDVYQTYLDTNDPAYQPDADIGRPVEMFGVGYRNGYDAISFSQSPAFGNESPGQRNAYAVGWRTNGVFADVSNNVGKTNDVFPHFEAWPFAVGQVTNAAAGQIVPAASKMFFELDITDPTVITYLQNSLNIGMLNFDVSTLYSVLGYDGVAGAGYPAFLTQNSLAPTPTRLELEVTVIRDVDTDGDGLPDDWEMFYFGNLDQGANDDPDSDGISNLAEYRAGTDPTRADSAFYIATTNAATLHWPNLPSRKFNVQVSEDLANWQTITNPAIIYPTPALATWTDTNAPAAKRFYRVQVATP